VAISIFLLRVTIYLATKSILFLAMKLRAAVMVILLSQLIGAPPAHASYNGVVDYSNPRIVPIFDRVNSPYPNYSGYIYSPRIIFTAGHGEARFSSDGTRLPFTPGPAYVGLPNSKTTAEMKRIPVVQRYLSTTIREVGGLMGDFAIYVLGEDIGDFKPAKLGTLEIQKELEAQKAFVEITGYGEYRDRCDEGEKLPCTAKFMPPQSQEPRKLKVQVRPYEDFLSLVGYERPQVKGSLLTWGGGKISPCGGDSGGSVTTTYKGEEIYLAVTPNGMNGYACGAAGYYDGKGGIGYASPIQDHLDILKEAEDYVAAALEQEALAKAKAVPTPSPTPSPSASPSAATAPKTKRAAIPKKKTITCVQGKTTAKITGIKPKCPPGYKKR
jgi:hypothetical protein